MAVIQSEGVRLEWSNLTPSLSTPSHKLTIIILNYAYAHKQTHTPCPSCPSTAKYFVRAHPYIQTLTRMHLLMHAYSGQASLRPPHTPPLTLDVPVHDAAGVQVLETVEHTQKDVLGIAEDKICTLTVLLEVKEVVAQGGPLLIQQTLEVTYIKEATMRTADRHGWANTIGCLQQLL